MKRKVPPSTTSTSDAVLASTPKEIKRKVPPAGASTSNADQPATSKGMKRRPPPCTTSTSPVDRASTSKDFINDDELMKALHYSVAKSAEDLSNDGELTGMTFDSSVLSNVTSLVWDTVVSDWTADLLAFSSHAKRATVDKDDVLLLMRRNESLTRTICSEAGVDCDPSVRKLKTPAARKRKSDLSSDGTRKITKTTKSTSPEIAVIEEEVLSVGSVHREEIPVQLSPGASNWKNDEKRPEAVTLHDSFDDPVDFGSITNVVFDRTLPPKEEEVRQVEKKEKENIHYDDRFSDDEPEVPCSHDNPAGAKSTGAAFSAFTFETQDSDHGIEHKDCTNAINSDVLAQKKKSDDDAYDSFDEELDTFLSISRVEATTGNDNTCKKPADDKDSFDDSFNDIFK